MLAKAPDRLEDCRLEQPTRPGGKSKQDDTQSTLAGGVHKPAEVLVFRKENPLFLSSQGQDDRVLGPPGRLRHGEDVVTG